MVSCHPPHSRVVLLLPSSPSGDVPRHRAFNLRALQLALAVIWMRILLVLVVSAGLESDGFNALKAILWLTWMVRADRPGGSTRWVASADLCWCWRWWRDGPAHR